MLRRRDQTEMTTFCDLKQTVSDAGEAPGFQLDGGLKLQGMRSSMRLLEWPGRFSPACP